MSEIKRWEAGPSAVIAKDGSWVAYHDHKSALAALKEESEERIAEIDGAVSSMKAEINVALSMKCTSPWPDSPPCSGIQKQIDRADAAEAKLGEVREDYRELEEAVSLHRKEMTGHGQLEDDALWDVLISIKNRIRERAILDEGEGEGEW